MITKLRWRIWGALSRLPGICPANAHSVVIDGYRRSPAIDRLCRQNIAGNGGSCWCGKLREPAPAARIAGDDSITPASAGREG